MTGTQSTPGSVTAGTLTFPSSGQALPAGRYVFRWSSNNVLVAESAEVELEDNRAQVRAFNNLLICNPTCGPFTGRLTASEGFTWFARSGTFSPYQRVGTPTLSNFVAAAVEFPELGSLFFVDGPFAIQPGRKFLLFITLDGFGNPLLEFFDEGPITALAPQEVGTPIQVLRGRQQEGKPAIRFAPLQDKMREPSVR